MPTVPVTDLVVHPREHDLIVATYGAAVRGKRRLLARSRRARSTRRAPLCGPADEAAQRGRMGQLRSLRRPVPEEPNEPSGLVFDYY